jgi:hypothetical protein
MYVQASEERSVLEFLMALCLMRDARKKLSAQLAAGILKSMLKLVLENFQSFSLDIQRCGERRGRRQKYAATSETTPRLILALFFHHRL